MIAVALIVIDVETRAERNAVEQLRHVVDRVDRHADPADLAGRERVIRVVAHLRRQIERDAQAGHPLVEQVAIAPIGLRGGAEARVLAHRPQPAAIHRRLDAAREGKRAGKAELVWRIPALERVGIENRTEASVTVGLLSANAIARAATHCSKRWTKRLWTHNMLRPSH